MSPTKEKINSLKTTAKNYKIIKPLLKAPLRVQKTISKTVKQINKNDPKSQFLEYLINLALDITKQAPDMSELSSQTAYFTQTIEILSQPEIIKQLAPEADPLMIARLRGQQRKIELLYENDIPLSSEEVANLLQMTRQGVDKRRLKGKLLALSLGKRGYLYPSWQFQNGKVIEGLERILIALEDLDNWTKLMFLKTGDIHLAQKTPLECLIAGEIEIVVQVAQSYGKQTAV